MVRKEMSEYDTVQSTVLADGWRYLTLQLCAAWLLCQLATSESGNYDAGVTCVSRVIISTLHWSVLTVYFKSEPPASVYAVRNEQGFRTPGVFSCNAFSFQRRLQQLLCFDVRGGRKTVLETLIALRHCVHLLWATAKNIIQLWHYNLRFLLYYNDINIYMDFLVDSDITLVRFICSVWCIGFD